MSQPQRDDLSEEEFIRHRLYGGSGSAGRRYAALVLARPSFWALLRYELLTTLLGPIPGALGILLRKVTYPSLFARCGRGVVFGARVTIRHPERIRLGDRVVLDDDVLIDGRGAGEEGVVLGDRVIVNRRVSIQAKVGAITIGADTSIGAASKIISQGPIRIAENVSLAGGSTVAGGRFAVERTGDPDDDKRRFTGGEIRIERSARLGMGAMVQDGVRVGEAAIVAPASVVVSDVPDHSVVAGNPARPWRERKVRGETADGVEPAATPAAATPAEAAEEPAAGAADGIGGQVRAYLEETRFAEFGDGGLSDADSLFDNDIIDSLGLVSLVAWLEKTFDIAVTDEDLVPENLESVARITAFVRGRVSAGEAG